MNKQLKIVKYLSTVEQASLLEISENTNIHYYDNTQKHLGAVMSRMVKAGIAERIKPGTFKLIRNNSTNLFNQTKK